MERLAPHPRFRDRRRLAALRRRGSSRSSAVAGRLGVLLPSASSGRIASYQSRHLRAAPAAARASRRDGGPRPSILRLSSWRPSRAVSTTSSIGVGQGADQGGDDVEVAGPRQRPGGDLAKARVAVGQELAEPVLVRPEHVGAFGLVAGDQPREGRVGVLRRGSSSTASIPSTAPFIGRLTTRPPATVRLDRSFGSPRPPSSVPAPSRLISIRWSVLRVDAGQEEDRPDGVHGLAEHRGPGAVGLLGRQDELPALLEPVDPAERLALGQRADPLDAVEGVVDRRADDLLVGRREVAGQPAEAALNGLLDPGGGGPRARTRGAVRRGSGVAGAGSASSCGPGGIATSCRWQISRLPTPAAVIEIVSG